MNDVGQIGTDCTRLHFPPLLDWEEVLQEERTDRLGFARRTVYALLTQSAAELIEGFGGENQAGLEGARRVVGLFQAHLQEMARFAEIAEVRLEQVAKALAVDP